MLSRNQLKRLIPVIKSYGWEVGFDYTGRYLEVKRPDGYPAHTIRTLRDVELYLGRRGLALVK
ncbi:hypothetical protein MTAT_20110 [Moorella thermoacetica]|uniref:Uncharacterized protein n=1 Tax=Neomoorella thermoacetica TaxID=1525 RepID=A0AAC9HKB3_NEOTH|nr:hypothetical protein Maut_02238 [Moorella thermoacetica]TYL12769.1 hypothetical protein MTAT_20110 [Moorella thermoacetica]